MLIWKVGGSGRGAIGVGEGSGGGSCGGTKRLRRPVRWP